MHNGLWADTGAGRQHSRTDPRLSREAAKAKASGKAMTSGKGPTDCCFFLRTVATQAVVLTLTLEAGEVARRPPSCFCPWGTQRRRKPICSSQC